MYIRYTYFHMYIIYLWSQRVIIDVGRGGEDWEKMFIFMKIWYLYKFLMMARHNEHRSLC
jgi:hypothetical protein